MSFVYKHKYKNIDMLKMINLHSVLITTLQYVDSN